MSKIVISGYYGFNNIGDEAVLYSILKSLRLPMPKVELTVLSHHPVQTNKFYQVASVNRWNFKDVYRALKECDVLISGGGSLLQDVTSPKSVIYYEGIVLLAKLLKKKVIYLDQGIGPLNTWLGRTLVPWVSNKVDKITVRDQESKTLLMDLGVKKEIEVTADAVFALAGTEMDRQAGLELLRRNGGEVQLESGAKVCTLDKKTIGISVRAWKNYEGYYKVVAKVADALIKEGYEVAFLPFHFPEDVGAVREVVKLMTEGSTMIREICTVEEMLSLMGNLHLVIGMRLHALIMASVMGTPCVGISYDPKVDNILKMLEMPNAGRVETLSYELLWEDVQLVLNQYEGLQQKLKLRVQELKKEAEKAIQPVLEWL
jgi:polysaccharide pyruvyl transferase CsaB